MKWWRWPVAKKFAYWCSYHKLFLGYYNRWGSHYYAEREYPL